MRIHIKHILFIALMLATTLGANASVLDSLSYDARLG